MKNISDEEFQKLYDNWEIPMGEVAELIECDPSTVRRRARKLGLVRRLSKKVSVWRVYTDAGYVVVRVSEDHPMARGLGASAKGVLEHRLVMAEHLGRMLEPWEDVHHINGVRDDNRIENLEIWSDAKRAQPRGVRDKDQIAHAVETLRRLAPELLSEGGNNA